MNNIINTLVIFAILFPMLVGFVLLFIKSKTIRKIVVTISAMALIISSILFYISTPFQINVENIKYLNISTVIAVCDFVLLSIIIFISFRYKRVLPVFLALAQLIPLSYIEFRIKPYVEDQFRYNLFLNDYLSMVMMFLILIIGSLIAIFALRYMSDYEHHGKVNKSRQPFFFFIIFLFLGAMSGLVLSNNLLNMYFFWELTTLCSFLLISFSKTEEAINNAFRALWINLIGGVAFVIAILLIYGSLETFRIDQILAYGYNAESAKLLFLPLCLLAIAGFTKSAQFPFQSWLLGAMVAPTPVSALLHSSTMVKAGVYLLVRFSPLFMNTKVGYAIAIIGGFTFFSASALAISQSNSKRVLAYSTIANLGLIVATAGIGTPMAVTAAILLIIFHAVSKGLLFLCVGTIEHGIGSRDVEDMDGLISKMPLIGTLTVIGMFSMLLPPFGVLITKLLSIEAAAAVPAVLILLALGSALTLVFWAKWMGKVLTVTNEKVQKVENYSLFTVFPLAVLALLVIGVSVAIPLLNRYFVLPYIYDNWMEIPNINMSSMMLIPIFIAILCLICLIPIVKKKTKNSYKSIYLCGENNCDGFTSAQDEVVSSLTSNYYLEQFFKEDQFTIIINILAFAFIIYMFGVAI